MFALTVNIDVFSTFRSENKDLYILFRPFNVEFL